MARRSSKYGLPGDLAKAAGEADRSFKKMNEALRSIVKDNYDAYYGGQVTGDDIKFDGSTLLLRLYRPGETTPRGKQLTWAHRIDGHYRVGDVTDRFVQVRLDEDYALCEPDKALDRLHRYLDLVVAKGYLDHTHASHIFRTLSKEIQHMAMSWNTTYSANTTATLEYKPYVGSITTNGSIGGYYPPPPPKPKTNVDWLRTEIADMVGAGRAALNAA